MLRLVLQQPQRRARGRGQHGGQRGAEGVGRGRQALVLDDLAVAGAEAAARAERPRERADDHVDGGRVDVLVLGDAAGGAAQDAVGPGFVEDEPEFVAVFELDLGGRFGLEGVYTLEKGGEEEEGRCLVGCQSYHFGEVHSVANGLEETLSDDEFASQRLLRLFLRDFAQHSFQVLHVVVFVPSHRASRDLDSLPDGEVDRFVCYNDIAAF